MTLIQSTFVLEFDFENIGSNDDMRILSWNEVILLRVQPKYNIVREIEEIIECTESNVTVKPE